MDLNMRVVLNAQHHHNVVDGAAGTKSVTLVTSPRISTLVMLTGVWRRPEEKCRMINRNVRRISGEVIRCSVGCRMIHLGVLSMIS